MMNRSQIDCIPVKSNFSSLRAQCTCNNGNQGRLAGAVFAEEYMNLSRAQVEIDMVQCANTGKLSGDVDEIKKQRVLLGREPVFQAILFALNRQDSFVLVHGECWFEAFSRERGTAVKRIYVAGVDDIKRRSNMLFVGFSFQNPNCLVNCHTALYDS